MSLKALPLILVPFIFYNLIVLLGGSGAADDVFRQKLFAVPMMGNPVVGGRGGWVFSWGDLIVFVTMIVLFFEILKSSYTSTTTMLDHGLSMIVFIAALVEFLLVPGAQTSVFFFIMLACVIDIIAGYTIGIRTARRDLTFGTDA